MPYRTITVGGSTWRVAPSGFVSQMLRDEFALVFMRGEGLERETRVVRYSPQTARTREESFVDLTDEQLVGLLARSQPGVTSPEAHYSS